MSDGSSPAIPTDADLLGLPDREGKSSGHGRDLIEQLATEFLDAIRSGKQPTIEEYVQRHPDRAKEIEELFPLIGALEDWKQDRELSSARETVPETFDIQQLGECRIIREIARGGMGVVFEAEEGAIARRVAVKLLPWKFSSGSRWRDKFQQEARTAARLRHPNIVSVYSFGEQDRTCYYVMQLVEGVGLNRLIDRLQAEPGVVTADQILVDFLGETQKPRAEQRQTAKRVLRRDGWPQFIKIALKVADAIRYAHSQGTLHRDIKPANLLIDSRGDVWVADFGLALPVEEAVRDGQPRVAGTLRYIAPEQFEGQVDERSDLYSFGLTLYELCTLQPAYEADERKALIQQIRTTDPVRPRKVNPEIPKPLEAVILKASERNPQKRYQSAGELIADLRSTLSPRGWTSWFRKSRR